MKEFKFTINKFDNGMRNDCDDDDAPQGYTSLIKNLSLAKKGSLVTRKGYSLVGTKLTSAGKVQGLGFREDNNGNPEWWRVVEGKLQFLNYNTLFTTSYKTAITITQNGSSWSSPSSASTPNGTPATLQSATYPIGTPVPSVFISNFNVVKGSTLILPNQAGNILVNPTEYSYADFGGSNSVMGVADSNLIDTYINANDFGFRIGFSLNPSATINFSTFGMGIPSNAIISGLDVRVISRVRIYDNGRSRFLNLLETPIGSYYLLIEFDSLQARTHYFLPPTWQDQPTGQNYLYNVNVVNASSTGSTMNVNTSIINAQNYIGAYVYNLTNNQHRVIVNNLSGTSFVVDKPINDSWDGASIVIQDEISFANYRDQIYVASSSRSFPVTSYTPTTADYVTSPNILGKYLATHGMRLFIAHLHGASRICVYTHVNTNSIYDATGVAGANADVAGANTVTATTSMFTTDMVGSLLIGVSVPVFPNRYARITKYISPTVVLTDIDTSIWNNSLIGVVSNYLELERAITGAIGFDNFIAIFDSKDVYVYNVASDSLKVYRNRGCLSNRSIQISTDGLVYYSNAEGIYVIQPSGVPVKVSARLRNNTDGTGIMDLLPPDKYSLQAGGILNDDYYLSAHDLTSNFNNLDINNATIVYNTPQDNFRIYDYPAKIYASGSDLYGSDQTLFADFFSNNVFQLNFNTKDWNITSNSLVDIPYEAIFLNNSFGRPDMYKFVDNAKFKYKSSGTVYVMISIDGGDWQPIAELPAKSVLGTLEFSIKKKCEYIGLRIFGAGVFELSSIVFQGSYEELKNIKY